MNEAVYNWKEGDNTEHVITYILKVIEDIRPVYTPPGHWKKEDLDALKVLPYSTEVGFYDGKILKIQDGDLEWHFEKYDVLIEITLKDYSISIAENYGYYGSDREYNYLSEDEGTGLKGFETLENLQLLNDKQTIVVVTKREE